MAIYYYDQGAAGANNGLTKADAFISFNAAILAITTDDILYCSHTSIEAIAVNTSFGFLDNQIISVDFAGSTPPVVADWIPGCQVNMNVGRDLTMNGQAYTYGMTFKVGDDFFCFGSIVMEAGELRTLNSGNRYYIYGQLELRNNVLAFDNAAALFFGVGGTVKMYGGSIEGPVNTFISANADDTMLYFHGVDFTGLGISTLASVGSNATIQLWLIGCKADPSISDFNTSPPFNDSRVIRLGTHDSNKPYFVQEATREGNILTETTNVKTGGATDGIVPQSLKYVTSAKAGIGGSALRSSVPVMFWADTTGNQTFELDVMTDGITLTKMDAWLETLHPQAGTGRKVWATSKDFAGANLDASAATWDETGIGAAVKQKISITVNVGQRGWVECRLYISRPSSTVYADMKIFDGGRQYITGGAYINTEAAVACDYAPSTDLRLGVTQDNGNIVGSLAVPDPTEVADGVATDDTVGNRTDAPEDKVENGFLYGPNGTGFEGTLIKTQYELPQEVIIEDEEIIIIEGCD